MAPVSEASPPQVTSAAIQSAIAVASSIELPPLTGGEIFVKALNPRSAEVMGVGRSAGDFEPLSNRQLDSSISSVAFRVRSDGAKHLRVGLLLTGAGNFRATVFSPGQEQHAAVVLRPSDAKSMDLLWTGITDGDTQYVVVERDGAGPWSASVSQLSHFAESVAASSPGVTPTSFGDSAYCQIDIACLIDVATPQQQTEILLASRAVALMLTTDSSGNTFSCTGTLLNSANYPAPILITANHCIDNAQNLLTLWFFSRSSCGVGGPSTYTQVTGGGTILFQSDALDAGLVLLNQIPPAPASYSGWDPALITSQTEMLAIHHPRGDVKKASFGQVIGTNQTPVPINPIGTFPPGTFYLVDWQYGIVEPGSSGSGLFTFGDLNQFYYLRATLTGGKASCSNSASRTYYSELANVYPYISTFLNVKAPPPGQLQMPPSVTFPAQQVGTQSAPSTATITNIGGSAVSVSSVSAGDLAEFPGTTTCLKTIAPGESCQLVLAFQPSAVGLRGETVTIVSDGVGSPQTFSISGTGSTAAPPPAGAAVAVEYYYAAWNFYFETSFAAEISALDGGAFGGVWKRTGQAFNVWASEVNAAAVPTCRFFSTIFDPKSSHFYTPFASECASLKAGTAWQYEGIAFYIELSDANGLCPPGTIPLYRAYNNGMGGAPNHRYTTSLTVLNQMLTAGWLFEGNGNTRVFACVPQ